jgi:mono/diheme cytochrome c family protein
MVLLLLVGAVWARTVITRPAAEPRAEQLVAGWESEYRDQHLYTRTPISLIYSRALSTRFTQARGKAEINFETGRVTVAVKGLDPLPAGAGYEVWLVDQVPGAHNTAAVDQGPDGDRILRLGALPATGSLVASVNVETLAASAVDMAAVMRVAPDRTPEYVIGGMQSIRFQVGREAALSRQEATGHVLAAGLGSMNIRVAARAQGKKTVSLVTQGQTLFFNETFAGNGRTCGTCHRPDTLTIDKGVMASLPSSDPLFVSENLINHPGLPPFDPTDPTLPALEDAGPTGMMRTRGLILENIDGFDRDPTNPSHLLHPPFFRASPALFNMDLTAPFGLSDCCADLQIFSTDAVIQHLTLDLDRRAGQDFRLPTAAELKALEAFMLSNASPASRNFKISGTSSLLSTKQDQKATDITRPEVRGRNLFLVVGCTSCHLGTVFSGGSANLNTGVEALERTLPNHTPTIDTGKSASGQFQIPQLFGLRKAQFFHSGTRGNKTDANGAPLPLENLKDAVSFYVTDAFTQSPEFALLTPAVQASLAGMTQANIDDLAQFLLKISVK